MARRNFAPGNSSYRLGYSERRETKNRRNEVSARLERKWFEFDRNIVTGVLDTLKGALHEGAAQMEMIAAEQMFDVSLSGTLSRTARRLGRMETLLKKLGLEVNGATGYPPGSQKT
jgi:hypothetical protein